MISSFHFIATAAVGQLQNTRTDFSDFDMLLQCSHLTSVQRCIIPPKCDRRDEQDETSLIVRVLNVVVLFCILAEWLALMPVMSFLYLATQALHGSS